MKELLHPEKVLSTQLISQLNQGHILFMKASSPEHGAKLYGLGQWSTTYRGIDTVSHTGSIHGHLSVIMRVPSRRIGFWVNVNDEDFGGSFNTVITNRLLDTLLGLDPIDWETRSFAPSLDKRILPPPESAHPRPPPMDVSILGTFFDPGYDSLVIQPLTDSKLARGFADVVTKGGMTLDLEGDGKIYFTRMDKLFLTHILFRHLDGPRFEWIRTIMFRALDGDGQITDDWIGRYYGRGQAVVTREGIGMFGGFWGVPGSKGLNVVEEDVELGAEVWFARVGV